MRLLSSVFFSSGSWQGVVLGYVGIVWGYCGSAGEVEVFYHPVFTISEFGDFVGLVVTLVVSGESIADIW